MTTVGILLAAGHARRFGADKLMAPLNGKPLVAYAAAAMSGATLDYRLVTGRRLQGFIHVPAHGDQGDSLRAGVIAAQALGASRILVALADMPMVDSALLDAVINACPNGGVSAATDKHPMPPACFDAAHFPDLLQISGDRGAAHLLRSLPSGCLIPAPGQLCDIDTPDDLLRLSS